MTEIVFEGTVEPWQRETIRAAVAAYPQSWLPPVLTIQGGRRYFPQHEQGPPIPGKPFLSAMITGMHRWAFQSEDVKSPRILTYLNGHEDFHVTAMQLFPGLAQRAFTEAQVQQASYINPTRWDLSDWNEGSATIVGWSFAGGYRGMLRRHPDLEASLQKLLDITGEPMPERWKEPAMRNALDKRLLWLWNTKNEGAGRTMSEQTFGALARTVTDTLGFDGLKVKIHDGTRWQGNFGMGGQPGFPRLDSPAALREWRDTLESRGVEFHATGVVWGDDDSWEIEAAFAIDALTAGARSFTWDVEPDSFSVAGTHQYWRDASWSHARELVRMVRTAHPNATLAIAPPAQHFAITPFGPGNIDRVPLTPFIEGGIDGICPQIYWTDWQRPAADILEQLLDLDAPRRLVQAFTPPVLRGVKLWPYPPGNATNADIEALGTFLQEHQIPGYTVFRFGQPSPTTAQAWKAARVADTGPIDPVDPLPPPDGDLGAIQARLAVLEREVKTLGVDLDAVVGTLAHHRLEGP